MGNLASKDGSHGTTGPHTDSFHTPPGSPQGECPSVRVPSSPASASPLSSPLTPVFYSPSSKKTNSTVISSPASSPPPPPPPSERRPHSPIQFGTNASQRRSGSTAASKGYGASVRNGVPQTSTPKTPTPVGNSGDVVLTKTPSPPVESLSPDKAWNERDSGVGQSPQTPVPGDSREEDLRALLQECRTTLGTTADQDGAMNMTEALRCLLAEVKSLRCSLQTERGEWLQFQADLQVAVSVADRLRAEAEEELAALRTAHKDMERELSTAQQRQKEADMQLLTLRGELKESRQRLAGTSQTSDPNDASHNSDKSSTNQDNKEETYRGRDRAHRLGGARRDTASHYEVTKREEPRTDVTKRYLRNVTNEERGGEEVRSSEARRAVTTERSRSLSRLPASAEFSTTPNRNSQSNTMATSGSSNKNLVQLRGRRSLDCQDGKSADKGKREESLNKYNSALADLPPMKSQDGFNLLLRRHGGSKRNSLLRWCQNRTQGYKNIDLTNFSSSWADGLAFCAIYHTYLPSHIPYNSLSPENKRENLSLAFKTGESVGIEQTLTLEEMLRVGGPDWQRVLTYVESVYRHFEM